MRKPVIIAKKQQGIALLMAIMIVALVAIISINMLTQRQLQIYRTANLYFRDQAYQYSLAIERWGVSVLTQDLIQGKKNQQNFDSHQDIWNTALVNFDVEQATIDGLIFDLQGRFNLNNLVLKGKVQRSWLDSYKRLLSSLGLSVGLADTLLDWIDANQQPTGTKGAEDIYYIALDTPYRTANQAIRHVSELLLIKGYDEKTIKILKPHIFVASDTTAINVNTSTPIVLQAIAPSLSITDAESLISQMEQKPFTAIKDFKNDPLIKPLGIDPNLIGVSSSYFVVMSHVKIDKTQVRLQSIIFRDAQGKVSINSRQESLWYEKKLIK